MTDTLPAQGRNIVLCLDGTKNQFSSTNSNLIKLFSVLAINDQQLVYYDSGVGTYLGQGRDWWEGVRRWVALTTDLAFAWNFKDHVLNAYIYLMNEYRDGDRIFIFGFSRGAYAARALAGMLAKVRLPRFSFPLPQQLTKTVPEEIGLLPKGNLSQISLAWEVYANPASAHAAARLGDCKIDISTGTPAEYKSTFSRRSRAINVHFVGVWDTVSALGVTNLPNLPFAGVVGEVKYFRQALALDERRGKFAPEYWHRENKPEREGRWIRSAGEGGFKDVLRRFSSGKRSDSSSSEEERTIELESSSLLRKKVDGVLAVKECWFSGVHSDIGGGNTLNGLPTLSNISLRWMLHESVPLGLLVDTIALFRSPVYNYSYPEIQRLIPPQFINFRWESERKEAYDVWDERPGPRVDERSVDVSEIVRWAAELDARGFTAPSRASELEERTREKDVQELGEDLAEDRHESLKGFYKLVEWMPLQRWIYVEATDDSRKDTRKLKRLVNMGRPRQMLHTQRIHRSVLHKLAYERYMNEVAGNVDEHGRGRFTAPKAVPSDFRTWEELLDVPGDRVQVWEY